MICYCQAPAPDPISSQPGRAKFPFENPPKYVHISNTFSLMSPDTSITLVGEGVSKGFVFITQRFCYGCRALLDPLEELLAVDVAVRGVALGEQPEDAPLVLDVEVLEAHEFLQAVVQPSQILLPTPPPAAAATR